MRHLTLSLLVVVLISMLGLGWALDSLFERYSNQSEEDLLQPYREMGVALSRSLDINKNPQEIINNLNVDTHLSFSLTPEKAFLLPQELKQEFINGKPLALESKDSISLNLYLPHSQQVLALSSPGRV